MNFEQSPKLIILEMLKAYASQALKTEVVGLLTGLLMAFFFWDERTQCYLSYWLIVLVLGPFIHHMIIHQFNRTNINVFQTLNLLKGFWFGSGCLWGAFVVICLNTADALNIAILTGLVAGMLVGAMPGASMLGHVYVFFAIPLCLFYSFAMFNDVSDINIMGVLGFIMLGLVLMLSNQLHIEFRRSINLRFEKNMVLKSLQEQKQAADKANKDKTHFLAAASHDLRQPHQAVGLFIEALDHLETEPKKKEIIAKTKQAFQAMSSLLDQLLDISKLDSASVQVNKQNIPLQPLLHQVVMQHMGEAEKKDIELRLRATQETVFTDPAMLTRIVSNLVTNAIRYTEKGGVLVAVRKRKGELWLDVLDTGLGIPDSQRVYVFKEFTQLGNPERDREKGLGLGLAIVQRLIKILGSDLVLQSKVGHGSRFSLKLEGKHGDECNPEVAQHLQVVSLQNLCVVVIDDDKIALESMQTLLNVWGCEVLIFSSQNECLSYLEVQGIRPDMLIVDYRLRANQNGLVAIDTIHQLCNHTIPALIVTGDTAPERIQEAKNTGLSLLHKPVNPDELKDFLIRAQLKRL